MTPEELHAIRDRHGDTSRELQELRADRGRDYGTVVHRDRGDLLAEVDRLNVAHTELIVKYSAVCYDAAHLLAEVDRLNAELAAALDGRTISCSQCGATLDRLAELTGTEHEHDRDSPFTRAIARHRARQEER